jgi:uncharacterized protein (DUF1778 family)
MSINDLLSTGFRQRRVKRCTESARWERAVSRAAGRVSAWRSLVARWQADRVPGGGLPAAARGRTVNHAQERPKRELASDLEPGLELPPRPSIHSDLTALASLPTSNEDRAAGAVEVALLVGWLDNPLLYCHCKYMSTTKEERLQIRVGPADKVVLERAAAASHLNVSAFVIQAAASKAQEVLAERWSIRLSAQASAAFTEALERPAEVNDRLAKALRRKRKFSWLD